MTVSKCIALSITTPMYKDTNSPTPTRNAFLISIDTHEGRPVACRAATERTSYCMGPRIDGAFSFRNHAVQLFNSGTR
jgi:hypothetical protein